MNIPRLPLILIAVTGLGLLVAGLVMLATQRRLANAGSRDRAELARPIASTRSPSPPAATGEPSDAERAGKIIDRMNSRALENAPPMVYLGESTVQDGGPNGAIVSNGKGMGRGLTLLELLASAYGTSRSRVRLAEGVKLPAGRFDYLVTTDSGQKETLQRLLRETFGLTAHPAAREEDVYVMRARSGEFDHRRPSEEEGGGMRVNHSDDSLNLHNASMAALARSLEQMLSLPVLDESGLRGRFDIMLTVEPTDEPRAGEAGRPAPDSVRKAALDQLGLELQREKRELEVLIVEKS